jgi:hypothetical protein
MLISTKKIFPPTHTQLKELQFIWRFSAQIAPKSHLDMRKAIFRGKEIVRFVPNSSPQAPKSVKLRHFYVIEMQKNANVTPVRINILRKTLKIEFYSTLRQGQNCRTSNFPQINFGTCHATRIFSTQKN